MAVFAWCSRYKFLHRNITANCAEMSEDKINVCTTEGWQKFKVAGYVLIREQRIDLTE